MFIYTLFITRTECEVFGERNVLDTPTPMALVYRYPSEGFPVILDTILKSIHTRLDVSAPDVKADVPLPRVSKQRSVKPSSIRKFSTSIKPVTNDFKYKLLIDGRHVLYCRDIRDMHAVLNDPDLRNRVSETQSGG